MVFFLVLLELFRLFLSLSDIWQITSVDLDEVEI